MVDISRFKKMNIKNHHDIIYSDIQSSIASVQQWRTTWHSEDLNMNLKNFTLVRKQPHFPNQQELGLIWDLTKSNAKLLTSRQMEWNLLDNSCQTTAAGKKGSMFSFMFPFQDLNQMSFHLVPPNVSNVLFCITEISSHQYQLSTLCIWRKTVKIISETTDYNRYKWQVCGNIKIIKFLTGLQGG